ncbi:MAG TPA: DUF1614 domain-containing protein [Thermoplasmata archaeon]
MADQDVLIALVVAGIVLLLFYLYLSAVQRAFRTIGFTPQEAGAIIFLTLFLGWVTIPVFPYNGWWVGISIGGALVPIIICAHLLKSRRADIAEVALGTLIVAYASYFVTRPEEGVGIVSDLPYAFIPAIAAGLFSLSVFWMDIAKAAPLAYTCGIFGTLIGADVFHLSEMLSFTAPSEVVILSVGGANIFDMVYLTGIVAVAVDMVAFWIKTQQQKRGLGAVIAEFQTGGSISGPSRDMKPAPKLVPTRKGRLP